MFYVVSPNSVVTHCYSYLQSKEVLVSVPAEARAQRRLSRWCGYVHAPTMSHYVP